MLSICIVNIGQRLIVGANFLWYLIHQKIRKLPLVCLLNGMLAQQGYRSEMQLIFKTTEREGAFLRILSFFYYICSHIYFILKE